jgi:ATPase subunit of ABC transporter with duplicated ATPase domains
LSHGERKRAQIAVALWRRPLVLALDEPTNHIDLDARRLLARALRSFRGVGLLVSHDRELLDALCSQSLFFEPQGPVMRPGGYTKATGLAEADQEEARRLRAKANEQLAVLQREAADREREAAKSHSKRSKRGLNIKDHDSRNVRNRARATGKDGQAGHVLRQLDGRLRQVQAKLESIRATRKQRLGIEMQGAYAKRNELLRLPERAIDMGSDRQLVVPELSMAPEDRVALIGPNGSGKSTLVRHIVGKLDVPNERLVYLAQEIDESEARQVIATVRSLPDSKLGEVMTIVSCLGSQPERLLETDLPSPGEIRKIMLALGMAFEPHLIIMDEPTNHLDLPSIECLETALADCPCALLLVSHDLRLLRKLTQRWWQISFDPHDPGRVVSRLQVGYTPPS